MLQLIKAAKPGRERKDQNCNSSHWFRGMQTQARGTPEIGQRQSEWRIKALEVFLHERWREAVQGVKV